MRLIRYLRARAPRRSSVPVWLVALLVLLVCAQPTTAFAARTAEQRVVLSQDDGLCLIGMPSALRGRPAPALTDLTEAAANAAAPLPTRRSYFRGAYLHSHWRYRSPLLLTFTLPKAIFAGSRLPLYRYRDHVWRRLERAAVVGRVNTTATATVTRPGRYALFLNRLWKEVSQDGYDLVLYTGAIPRTVIRAPKVLASGATDDQAVIQAVMDMTGSSEESAKGTLASYDSRVDPVVVLKLTADAMVMRDWSGTTTVGRWFAPHEDGPLASPETARVIYALPVGNLAINTTLHLMKPGTGLIVGTCSDMTAQQGYGPWATGGGPQLFGPKVSTYPPPAYDPTRTVIVSELRWEERELTDIRW